MRILITDEADSHRETLAAWLRSAGHDVTETDSGPDAETALADGRFRVVIAGAASAGRDDFGLLRRLRERPPGPYTWVTLLTDVDSPIDVIEALEAGADDFLTRPVREAELRARLLSAARVLSLEEALAERNDRLGRLLRESQRDLEAAALMQRALLPSASPEMPGLRAAWRFAPCQGVAGDVVGAHALDDEHAAFYMVDVAGHGVPAAMLAFTLSRMLVPGRQGGALGWDGASPGGALLGSPSELLAALNDRFPDDGEATRYFTACYGVWNSATHIARVAQAGHPAPIIQRGSALLPLVAEGRPIGLFPNTVYDELEIELQPEERLFLYSDGVTEARNAAGEPYGLPRLLDVLRQTRGATLPNVAAAVEASLGAWHAGTAPRDDITFLALEAA